MRPFKLTRRHGGIPVQDPVLFLAVAIMTTETLLLPGPPPFSERLQVVKDLIPLRKLHFASFHA